MKKTILISSLMALFISLSTVSIFYYLNENNSKTVKIEHINTSPAKGVALTVSDKGELVPLDFTKVAEQVKTAVVHIKSTQAYNNKPFTQKFQQKKQLPDPFREFFGESPFFRFETPRRPQTPQARIGTGSGVIINEKGYIVTNNHVIAEADDIEVTLHDNRTFKATIVGTDPSTDLALIQIKGNDLPTIPLMDSETVKVGEWVLAVGNPMGLNSTVTAGIVSAKGRNINILKEQFAVESFIQTDAAINPGNSGGALVDLQGGLIGINTAIASPTGVYAGYGFAVPSNIVNKVVEDLIKYGVVQRAVLGVMIRSIDGNLAKEKELDVYSGVYVDSLLENSAARTAGIEVGDVILEVGGRTVNTSSELQEKIASYRPGDKVDIIVNRKGQEKTFSVQLNNRRGSFDVVKKEHKDILNILGVELEELDDKTARQLDIAGGVKVKKLFAGKIRQHTEMQEGFIITKIDGKKVTDLDEVVDTLEGKKGGVMIEGIYEDLPGAYYYAFGM